MFPLLYNVVQVYSGIYFLKALALVTSTSNTTKSEQSLGGGTITAGNPRLLSVSACVPAVETEAMCDRHTCGYSAPYLTIAHFCRCCCAVLIDQHFINGAYLHIDLAAGACRFSVGRTSTRETVHRPRNAAVSLPRRGNSWARRPRTVHVNGYLGQRAYILIATECHQSC